MDIKSDNLRTFFSFISKRHLIYKNRFVEKLEKPWTDDKILMDFKFTNVFRDLDP